MKKLALLTTVFSVLILSGCASTTKKAHAERNANISLSNLLGEDSLTQEERERLITQFVTDGETALSERNFGLATRNVSRVLRLDPEHIGAKLILAKSALRTGRADDALKMFEAINEVAVSTETKQGIGLSLINTGDIELGRSALNEALQLDPGLWRAYNGLGVSYAIEKDWVAAENAYLQAMALSPKSPEIYNNLGFSYLQQGDFAKALTTLSQAMAIPNSRSISDANYRWAQALNGKISEAMIGLDDVGRAQLYNNLGESALSQQEFSKAITYFKTALNTHPSYFREAELNLQSAVLKAKR